MRRRPRRATTTTALPSRSDLALALTAGLLLVPSATRADEAAHSRDAGVTSPSADAGTSLTKDASDAGTEATLVLHADASPDSIVELAIDGQKLDVKDTLDREMPITPGAHRITIHWHASPPIEQNLIVATGEHAKVTLLPYPEPILGGVPPQPPPIRGCCGSHQDVQTASTFPGGMSALFGLALFVGRRRRR
jgi:MYXO-CTERM domain-containing protein